MQLRSSFVSLLSATSLLTIVGTSGTLAATTLPNGGSVSDAISVPGDFDVHGFTAVAGDHIVLRIVDTSDTAFRPRLELSGPSGFIEGDTGQRVASIETDVIETGSFSVLVRDDSSAGGDDLETGTYELYYVRIPGANELGALANDSLTSETIDVGDLDTYTLDVSSGDHIVARITDTSGSSGFQPRLELYDPTGALIALDTGQVVATVEHDATVGGTFTLLIKDNSASGGGDSGTGTYGLYYTRIPGANELGALANDSLTSETIDVGDLDTYTLDVSSGDHIVARITDTSGSSGFRPRLELYDPTGALIGGDTGGVVATVEHDATVGGTFTLLIKDNSASGGGDSGTGAYGLYYTRIPGANELGALANDSLTSESIDVGDLDTYTLDVSSGDHIVARITDTSGSSGFRPRLELYDPTGALIGGDTGGVVATVEHDATVGGTFTLLIKDNSASGGGDSGTGTYGLYYTRIPGANELGTLDNDSYTFERIDVGDLDTYTLDVTGGDDVVLHITDTSGSSGFRPRLELYDPTGALVAGDTGQTAATVEHDATVGGTFTLLIKDNSASGGGDSGTGTYVLYYNYTGVLAAGDAPEAPVTAQLFGAARNPVSARSGSVAIRYAVPSAGEVTLELYGIDGRRARTLSARAATGGRHEILLSIEGLSSGVYFYRLTAGRFRATEKLLLTR